MVTSDLKWKYGRFAHAQLKIRNVTLIYGRIADIFASVRKSESSNTMVTSDFRPEVEIRPFLACAMKNVQYITLIYGRIAKIFALFMKSGSRNTMVTLDFIPEVEIWPFCACLMRPVII